jgi:hypothetical protein
MRRNLAGNGYIGARRARFELKGGTDEIHTNYG